MSYLLRSVLSEAQRDPVRATLTVLGMAIGVAILALTVNVGNALLSPIRTGSKVSGSRIIVANAESDGSDGLRFGPSEFELSDLEAIPRLVPTVLAITPIAQPWFTPQLGTNFGRMVVGDVAYQPRSVLAVGPGYAAVYDLQMLEGAFFTAEEDAAVVMTESAATAMFGSAEKAVGGTITARRSDGQPVGYTVVGVFADVPSDLRQAYGLADFLVPFDLPARLFGTYAVLSSEADPDVAATGLMDAVRSLHGAEVKVLAWQGSPWSYGDPTSRDAAERRSIALFLDSFGALALVIASTGIFTMMMVGIVERSRSIGLRRALGSTRTGIVVWLVGEAAVWALLGAVLGLALAALMSRPVWEALAPVLPGYDGGAVLSSAIRLDTAAVSTLSALGAAVLFGIAPALAAARIEPAEAARET